MQFEAKWIWKKQADYGHYNQTVIARRSVETGPVRHASMAITADSRYRLFINGRWVNDGPCRSWPEHFQYDEFDVTSYLHAGVNQIHVVARYFGVGTFHQIPQQAGLLAELRLTPVDGTPFVIGTDSSWEVAEAFAWLSNTPKVSIQMEPFEHYDARLEKDLVFEAAAELFPADAGPWKDLNLRDCALLSREPFAPRRFREANVVGSDWECYCFPVARLLHPGLVEANHHVGIANAVATVVVVNEPRTMGVETHGYHVTVNGAQGDNGVFHLAKGANLLLAISAVAMGHQFKEMWIRLSGEGSRRLQNPIVPDHENPWSFLPLVDNEYAASDTFTWRALDEKGKQYEAAFHAAAERLVQGAVDVASFKKLAGDNVLALPRTEMLMEDVHQQFISRTILGDARPLIRNPAALMYENAEVTVVAPSPEGDVELVYDLGQQNCGYWDIELIADEGVVVDLFAVEYIDQTGRLQHTYFNRNGMRFICKQGPNAFVSMKRRSGRYLFLTLRNQKTPVAVHKLQVVESTYPVEHVASFRCSDPLLDEIWTISERTLKLCMEDTFTDCPLYEQTHWVGDARNEALFALSAFGATDIARRCITLTGQSVERFPIAGCQTPSAWDILLPAWSFLWGISVWDYYFYSGDEQFVKKVWPWVMQNLQGAAKLKDGHGLFSGPFWNMFDWSGSDDEHDTVLHNSMFMVGAIDAARRCAQAIGDDEAIPWLEGERAALVEAINRFWDNGRESYPDSIHEDGAISPNRSQHTSFLALLYDIVEERNRQAAVDNLVAPPDDMVRIGSPFAILYLYEALEKVDLPDRIITSIYEAYEPMIEEGATTVWESFATGSTGSGGFPTRSHCHAWSSAPVLFLNRVILGIKQTAAAGRTIEISPRLNGLAWAKGAVATAQGVVSVAWHVEDDRLDVEASAPEGVKLLFHVNDSHARLQVFFNGVPVEQTA
jgi:alpha-L-rhamnosidase